MTKKLISAGVKTLPLSIVDAGMREMNETGFMHNRVWMIVASFLSKTYTSTGDGAKSTLLKLLSTTILL